MPTRIPVTDAPSVQISPRGPRNIIPSGAEAPLTATSDALQRQSANFRRISAEGERMQIFHDDNASTEAATAAESQMRDIMRNDFLTLEGKAATGATSAAEHRYSAVQEEARGNLGTTRAKNLYDNKLAPMRARLKDRMAQHEMIERKKWSDVVLDNELTGSIGRATDGILGDMNSYSAALDEGKAAIDAWHTKSPTQLAPEDIKLRKESYEQMFWTSVLDDARRQDPEVAEMIFKPVEEGGAGKGSMIKDPDLKSKIRDDIRDGVISESAYRMAQAARATSSNYDDQLAYVRKHAGKKIRDESLDQLRTMKRDDDSAEQERDATVDRALEGEFFTMVDEGATWDAIRQWSGGLPNAGQQEHYRILYRRLTAETSADEDEKSLRGYGAWMRLTEGQQVALLHQKKFDKSGNPIPGYDALWQDFGLRGAEYKGALAMAHEAEIGQSTLKTIERTTFKSIMADAEVKEDEKWGVYFNAYQSQIEQWQKDRAASGLSPYVPRDQQEQLIRNIIRQDLQIPSEWIWGPDVTVPEILNDPRLMREFAVPPEEAQRIHAELKDVDAEASPEAVKEQWLIEQMRPGADERVRERILSRSADLGVDAVVGP